MQIKIRYDYSIVTETIRPQTLINSVSIKSVYVWYFQFQFSTFLSYSRIGRIPESILCRIVVTALFTGWMQLSKLNQER